MKQTWLRLAGKIDALGLRERVLIFLMATVILIALVDATLLSPDFAKESELSQQIAQDQSKIAGIQNEIHDKVASYDSNPDAHKQALLQQLKQKSMQMQTALQDMQNGLVSPDRMTALLEDILKHNGKLHLLSLRTLPASGLNDPEVDDKDKDAANKNSAESEAKKSLEKISGTEAGTAKPADDKSPVGASAGLVYKHGVEIVIEGDYLDMVDYMTALEKLPWQLFWGRARLSVDDSGKRNLTLRLYTLSLDNKWLNI